MTKMPDEIKDVILQGLTNLMALRPRGAPGADTISATATAWIMALSAKPVAWDAKRDTARMQQAFVILMGSAETWPTPAAFYDRLPPREHQNKLSAPVDRTMSPATRKLVDGLLKNLRKHTGESNAE